MKLPHRLRWLALPGVLTLLAAAAPADPVDLVRRGNQAFAEKKYHAARALYDRAAGRIVDPGLTAFNQAAALYQLEQYREAELHYQYCLADATGTRRAQALYGLGTCLLQQRDRGTEVLSEAVRAFAECLRQEDVNPELAADARHNLELAKLLLAQATPSTKKDTPEPKNSSNGPDRKVKPKLELDKKPGTSQRDGGKPDPRKPGTPVQIEPGDKPLPTDERPPPGAGDLPPVPDKGELTPLAEGDAERHLDDAVQRIMRAQRGYRYRVPRAPGSAVLDW